MKKLLLLLLCLMLVGCQTTKKIPTTIEVTNLLHPEILDSLLSKEEGKDVLISHIKEFNSIDKANELIDEFKTIKMNEVTFDEYVLQDEWVKRYPEKPGVNCRMTTFGIMKNLIDIKNPQPTNENIIFLDVEALQFEEGFVNNNEELEKYKQLYTTYKAPNTTNQKEMVKFVEAQLQKNKVTFKDSHLSMINVYVHSNYSETENELFIGHTGVLIEKDNKLYFVEKLAFQQPYRLVKIQNRQHLKQYLETKYESYSSDEEVKPFVFENNKPL